MGLRGCTVQNGFERPFDGRAQSRTPVQGLTGLEKDLLISRAFVDNDEGVCRALTNCATWQFEYWEPKAV